MKLGIKGSVLFALGLASVLFCAKTSFAGPTGWSAMGTIDAGTYWRKTGDTSMNGKGNGFVTVWKNDANGGTTVTPNVGSVDPMNGEFGTALPPAEGEVEAPEGEEGAGTIEAPNGEEAPGGGMTGNNDGAGYSGNGESDFENGGKSDENDGQNDNSSDNSSTSQDSNSSQDNGDSNDDNDDSGDDGDNGGCTDCGEKGFENPDDLWWKGAKGTIHEYTPPDVGKGRVGRGTIHEYTPPEGVKRNVIRGNNGQTVTVTSPDGDWSSKARVF